MSKNPWKFFGIVAIAGVIIFIVWMVRAEILLARNHHFTIALTKGHGGGGSVDFEFSVNGVIYKRANKGLQLITNGRKYFVKYYVSDPSLIAKIVSNEEVPECIGEPPPDGWLEIPTCK